MFNVGARRAGSSTALFAGKTKFSLFERSWPRASTGRPSVQRQHDAGPARCAADLADDTRGLPLPAPLRCPTRRPRQGFMSPAYLDAVRATDRLLGDVVASIEANDAWPASTVLVAHRRPRRQGPRSHTRPDELVELPDPVHGLGPGVEPGTDLYDLNPDYRDPGTQRTEATPRRASRSATATWPTSSPTCSAWPACPAARSTPPRTSTSADRTAVRDRRWRASSTTGTRWLRRSRRPLGGRGGCADLLETTVRCAGRRPSPVEPVEAQAHERLRPQPTSDGG